MMINIILLLFLIACAAIVVASLLFMTEKIGDHRYSSPEEKLVAGVSGFVFLIVGLLVIAVLTGDFTFGESIPDGCYRVYNETSTSFIPNGNGSITPIVTGEQHYLPIRCP